MYSKVLLVVALAAAAQSRDLFEGSNKTEARNIYDKHLQASPAIWKQSLDIFINTTEHEIISLINITDLRPEKDGEIQLVGGGVGHNNASFTLKSPTILRGYDFLVQVFSMFGEEKQGSELDGDLPGETDTKLPRDVSKTTEKSELPTESKLTTEGATVTYPTQTPTDVTMTLATGRPTDAPTSRPKTKEVVMPESDETDVSTETPAPEVPEEAGNMPKLQAFVGVRPPSRQH